MTPDRAAPAMRAVVIGATGGIGAALVDALARRGHDVQALSRRAPDDPRANVTARHIDLSSDASIAAAAQAVASGGAPDLVIVATGMLHDPETGIRPEKTLRSQSRTAFETLFAVNAIGPAMIARHFLPMMPRDRRSVAAFLSARVGSISDNRLGGWHAYRASKAALNMLIRNWSIEMARSHSGHVCVGLHPGTVATPLSAPFRGNVAAANLFSPETAARHLLTVAAALTPDQSGRVFDWAGKEVPA